MQFNLPTLPPLSSFLSSPQWVLVADFFLLESRGGLAGDKQIKSVAGECDCCTFLFLFMSLFWGVVACSGCLELTWVGGQ